MQWEGYRTQGAPAFLHDIAPAGAAKRFLMAHIGRDKPDNISADLFLLMRSTPAPISHMRIKESVGALDSRPPIGFARQEVIQRDSRFLEYVYDLAPMVMDDEGITRTTKWPRELERAGEVNWLGVCHLLGDVVDSQELFEGLREAAQQLSALPDILSASGLPAVAMNHPAIALKNLPKRLKEWGFK